jgi:hypothetical protein
MIDGTFERNSCQSPTWRSLRAIGSSARQPQGRAFAPLESRLRAWGRAVRDCCDAGRAGGIARQAIVSTGRRPVGPESQEELDSGEGGLLIRLDPRKR